MAHGQATGPGPLGIATVSREMWFSLLTSFIRRNAGEAIISGKAVAGSMDGPARAIGSKAAGVTSGHIHSGRLTEKDVDKLDKYAGDITELLKMSKSFILFLSQAKLDMTRFA